MSNKIKIISDASFEDDVINESLPVLVDFWAEWCSPCKSIMSILDRILINYQDRLIIAKLNIDDNRESPIKFGIRGVPTLLLFKNAQVEATKTGALSEIELCNFLDQYI
jgi:thioredoxin 1